MDGLTPSSDGSTPAEQTEQILAIYPILQGQKAPATNVIPAHKPSVAKAPVAEPQDGGNDLIDFGDAPSTDAAAPAPAVQPPNAAPVAGQEAHGGSKDIQSMLNKTGTQPDQGPLMDFTTDLKKEVPQLKRAETSEDSFHDAQEQN